ncbi:MAG: NAD(P)-dependent oxidoreductase [Thalassobaculaceae bacterium]|nr:NAD(P)-dependent oxidoreductase [Thalassobaculaceae bacterium]
MTDAGKITVAVTGAGGFLGATIARYLAGAGAVVHAFARSAPDLGSGIAGHGWDPTRDAGPPAPGLLVDAVIDCAAVLPSREPDGGRLKRVNAELVTGAVDLAGRSGGRLVFMSSQSVYGRPDTNVIGAGTPALPEIPYGEAKLQGERMLAEAVRAGRIVGAIALRLPAVVGPGAHDNFPATVANRARAGATVTLFNPDAPYNAVVSAESVARFAAHLAGSITGFHAVSLATTPPSTVRAAAEAIADGLGVPLLVDVRDAPHRSPTIDPAAAMALGYESETPQVVLRDFGRASR